MAPESLTLSYVKTIGICNNGLNGRGFTNPVDTAVSDDGRIFVLNRCDQARAEAIRVGICTIGEDYLGEFGDGVGDGDTQFKLVAGMAFDSEDRLHIVDEGANRITVFNSQGVFLSKWGSPGTGDGEFNGPSGIAFDSCGDCYISDQHNNRIQKFTWNGEFLSKWGEPGSVPGEIDGPSGLAFDADDNMYVVDHRNHRIQKFTRDGELLSSFSGHGTGEGQLDLPWGATVAPGGDVYVAEVGAKLALQKFARI